MARIRSVHPGLATDARFVVLSDAAQIFYVLLLTIADDAGVFRWEPLELRMQLRPASTSPIEPLLDELSAGNFLRRFEAGGNAYGAVRNFRRYQSPKLPTRRHPLPANLFPYVGLEPGALELVPKSAAKKKAEREEALPQDWASDGEALGKEPPKPGKPPKTNIELKQENTDQLTQPLPSATAPLPQRLPTERERERDRDKDKDKDKERERESLVDRTSSLPRETEPDTTTRPSPKVLKKVEGEAEQPRTLAELPEGWIAEAEAARDEAGLEAVNLTLEWLKFAARANGQVELRRWIEWSLRAWARPEPRQNGSGSSDAAALPEPPWDARMRHWHQSGWWQQDFGPKPNEPGCHVPTKYLA